MTTANDNEEPASKKVKLDTTTAAAAAADAASPENKNKNKKKQPTESDVYDRQIRLWGAESQAKMQKANILYINITGITAEVIKNLVLAGIKATIYDPRPSDQYLWNDSPHFLTPPTTTKKDEDSSKKTVAEVVKPVIEEMNLLLGECTIISSSTSKIQDLTSDDLQSYTAIVASTISKSDAIYLANNSGNDCHLYLADTFGFYGCCVIDLKPNFQYREEKGKDLLDPQPLLPYFSFEQIFNIPLSEAINRSHKKPPKSWMLYRCLLEYYEKKHVWPASTAACDGDGNENDFDKEIIVNFLKSQGIVNNDNIDDEKEEIISLVGDVGMGQVPPVCAVLGGLIGNEIIKAISGKGVPANNTLLFDGDQCKAWTFCVGGPKNKK